MTNGKFFVFHKAAVDGSSALVSDTGANIDLAAFPAGSLVNMVAEDNLVFLVFKDGGRYAEGSFDNGGVSAGEVLKHTHVKLTCTSANAHKLVKDIVRLMNEKNKDVIDFDDINNRFDSEFCTGITAIVRMEKSTTVTSDS